MIYLLDKNLKVIKMIRKTHFNSAVQTKELNSLYTLSLDIAAHYKDVQSNKNHNYLEDFKRAAYAGHLDLKNRFQVYKIHSCTVQNNILSVECVHKFFDDAKFGDVIRDKRLKEKGISYAAELAFKDIGWKLQDVDTFPEKSLTFFYLSPAECRKKIIDTWGAELDYSFTLIGNKVVRQNIDIKKKLGTYTGLRFYYGNNILNIKYEQDNSEIVTAVIGRGKGEEVGEGYGRRIEFKDIAWEKDGNKKPVGQDYIEIESATQEWGYVDENGKMKARIGVVEFPDITDKVELANATYDYLLKNCIPKIVYNTTISKLDKVVELGDEVAIIYKEIGLLKKARIQKITVNLLNVKDTKVLLGDYAYFKGDKTTKSIQTAIEQNKSEYSDYIYMLKEEFDKDFKAQTDAIKDEVMHIRNEATAQVAIMDTKITSEINQAKTDIKSEIEKAKTETDEKVQAQITEKETKFDTDLRNAKTEFTNSFTDLQSQISNTNNSIAGNTSYLSQFLTQELDKNKKLFDESVDNAKKYTDSKFTDSQNNFTTMFNAEKAKMLQDVNTSTDSKIQTAKTTLTSLLESNKRELNNSFDASVRSLTATLFTQLNNDLATARSEIESAKQIAQNNNALSSEELQKINDKVDNLHIGAVNLLKGSSREFGAYENVWTDLDVTPIFNAHPLGAQYTISFDIKSEDTSKQQTALVYTGQSAWDIGSSLNVPVTTDWTRQKVTITPKHTQDWDNDPTKPSKLYFYGGYKNGNKLSVKNVQLELGTVATDYAPSTEDTKAEIKVVADSITGKAIEAVRGDIGYLRTNLLTTNAINSTMIASGAITSDKLSSNSVTASKLYVDSSFINKIYADSMLANKIISDRIITQSMMTNALTVVYASVDELRSRIINSDSVTANNLYVDRSLINKLFADNLMANKIIGDYAIISTIKSKALEAVNANIANLRTNILTSDSIKANMLDVNYAMINKLMTNDLLTNRLVADRAFISSIKTKALEAVYANVGSLRSKLITANSIKASAIDVDYALVNKLVSNSSFVSNLTAQSAFIRSVKAIEVDATRITGGVLQSASGSMRWDLNGNSFDFYSSAGIEFHSVYNYLSYRNNGKIAYLGFTQTKGTTDPAIVIGASRDGDLDPNSGGYTGLIAHCATDQVHLIGDYIRFQNNNYLDTGNWLLETWNENSVRAFFGSNPRDYIYELGKRGYWFNTIWTKGINDRLKIYNYDDGASGITGSNGKFGIKINTGGMDIIYDGKQYALGDILRGTSWRV